jgi:GNAT superfamily N-acetyltransferase
MYRQHLGREPDEMILAQSIEQYPSAILLHTPGLIGFTYTKRFAPDILELANVVVALQYRNQGYGEQLVRYIEIAATPRYRGIILVNSMLYASAVPKRPAANFYHRLGYHDVAATSDTTVYYRELDQDPAL